MSHIHGERNGGLPWPRSSTGASCMGRGGRRRTCPARPMARDATEAVGTWAPHVAGQHRARQLPQHGRPLGDGWRRPLRARVLRAQRGIRHPQRQYPQRQYRQRRLRGRTGGHAGRVEALRQGIAADRARARSRRRAPGRVPSRGRRAVRPEGVRARVRVPAAPACPVLRAAVAWAPRAREPRRVAHSRRHGRHPVRRCGTGPAQGGSGLHRSRGGSAGTGFATGGTPGAPGMNGAGAQRRTGRAGRAGRAGRDDRRRNFPVEEEETWLETWLPRRTTVPRVIE